jgi:uncharacterized RDD family membrane protein YckC
MGTNDSFSWGAESLDRGGGRQRRVATRSSRRLSLLGARAAAILIDGLVLIVPVFGIAYVLSLVFPHHGFFFTSTGSGGSSAGAGFRLGLPGALVISALSLSYFFLFEALRGQTIGKRSMALRVQSAAGGPPGLNAISARTVLRLIDGLAVYLVGALIAILTGSRRRRLGDWLGGTVVVRDDAMLDGSPHRPLWLVLAYPLGWVAAVLIAIFALGLGTAAGADEQALSLVQSYVKARAGGDGALACSMLSSEQERELVAIQTRNYRDPDLAQCPAAILRSDPSSHLLNPELADFAGGPMAARYSSAGFAVVRSQSVANLELITVFENGRPKLDMRGVQRLGFVQECTATDLADAAECRCVFARLRADGLVEEAFRGGLTSAMLAESRRCRPVASAKSG